MSRANSTTNIIRLTDPLQDRCAPDKVKYLVRHLRNSRHRPFFSLSCPSMTGCPSAARNPTARSGWLQRKQPHCTCIVPPAPASPAPTVLSSNTSKKPASRSSFSSISCSCGVKYIIYCIVSVTLLINNFIEIVKIPFKTTFIHN